MNLLKRIRELKGLISNHECTTHEGYCECDNWRKELDKLLNHNNDRAYCATHPIAVIAKDKFGNWYKQCYHGWENKINGIKETCDIRIVDAESEVNKNE